MGSVATLFDLAWSGDLDGVVAALDTASVDAHIDGLTPLHLACAAGHTDVARALLDAGADFDAEAWPGLRRRVVPDDVASALACGEAWARINGRRSFVGENRWGAWGLTPLHLACSGGHEAVVRLLLLHGADPYVTVLLDGGIEGWWEWDPVGLATGQPQETTYHLVIDLLQRHMSRFPQTERTKRRLEERSRAVYITEFCAATCEFT
jgi:ankyrin repeat protein